VPESFSANPNVLEQKDVDARWGKKGDENQDVFADAGHVGEKYEKALIERGFTPQICERIPKSRPLLIPEVKENNREKSKIRCRIEHVFGEMKNRMGDETLRTIGFARARFWIGLRNLCYNMSRMITLTRPKKQPSAK
jgi:hypothetical protein